MVQVHKFNIGDKVHIIDTGYKNDWYNTTGVIVDTMVSSIAPKYKIWFELFHSCYAFYESSLRPVK